MMVLFRGLGLGIGLAGVACWPPALAQAGATAAIEAAPLPPGSTQVAASADECAVWQRELGFAASVAAHDARAFASYLHPGAIFDAGAGDAPRGVAAVSESWSEIVAGTAIALRWRPGIVQIGEPNVAVSKGPYILQSTRSGTASYQVGFYQTVWIRGGSGGPWRVLYDALASTPMPMASREAADAWVGAQAMSACAGS